MLKSSTHKIRRYLQHRQLALLWIQQVSLASGVQSLFIESAALTKFSQRTTQLASALKAGYTLPQVAGCRPEFPCIFSNGTLEFLAISWNFQQFHLRAAWKYEYERDRIRPAAKNEPALSVLKSSGYSWASRRCRRFQVLFWTCNDQWRADCKAIFTHISSFCYSECFILIQSITLYDNHSLSTSS